MAGLQASVMQPHWRATRLLHELRAARVDAHSDLEAVVHPHKVLVASIVEKEADATVIVAEDPAPFQKLLLASDAMREDCRTRHHRREDGSQVAEAMRQSRHDEYDAWTRPRVVLMAREMAKGVLPSMHVAASATAQLVES